MLNVSIEQELKNLYSAHCLDLDLVAIGETKDEAIDNLLTSIIFYFDFSEKIGVFKVTKAPAEYWEKLKDNQVSDIDGYIEERKKRDPEFAKGYDKAMHFLRLKF